MVHQVKHCIFTVNLEKLCIGNNGENTNCERQKPQIHKTSNNRGCYPIIMTKTVVTTSQEIIRKIRKFVYNQLNHNNVSNNYQNTNPFIKISDFPPYRTFIHVIPQNKKWEEEECPLKRKGTNWNKSSNN